MNLETLHILIADPERTAAELLARELRNAGADVQVVHSAAEALFQCEEEPPDAMVLDVRLPDMDGFEVCERIRHELHNAALTIIVTARPDDEMTQTYLGPMVRFVGGDYFVAKPSDPMFIVCLLSDLIHGTSTGEFYEPQAHPVLTVWPPFSGEPHASVN